MSNHNSVGVRIRIARISANLKQDQVAQKLGISKSNVSEWETGKRSPGIDQIEEIAKAIGTTSSFLLGFEKEIVSESNLSQEAILFAKDFDALDDAHKRLARGFMELLKSC